MPNRQIRSLCSVLAACVVALLSIAHARAAPVTWTGIGDGVSWTDPLNWSNANFMPPQPVPPGPNDQVIINGPGSVILGPAFAAININSLALSGGRTVRLDAGSLFVTSNITGTTADGVHLRGGMLALAGEFRTARLTLEAGALAGPIVLNAASVTSLAPLEGDLKLLGNTSWFGPIFGGQNLTLEARLNLASTLTFAAATTSTGSITLTSLVPSGSSQITVASGMFINAGTLTFASGGGSRTIAGNFTNTNACNINAPTLFSSLATPATYANTGTLAIAPGASLTVGGLTPTFNQTAGAITGAELLTAQFTQFNWSGGIVTNNNGLPASPTLLAGRLTLAPAIIQPINPQLTSLVEFVGHLALGQTITVVGQTGNNGVLRLLNNFTNAGTIVLTSVTTGQANINYFASQRTVTNTTTGFIRINPGAGGPRNIAANISNAGTIEINTPTNLAYNGGAYTNTGLIDITTNGSLTASASGQTLNLNSGTLRGADRLNLSNMFFFYNGGLIENTPGTVGSPQLTSCQVLLVSTNPINANFFGTTTLNTGLSPSHTVNVIATATTNASLTPANSILNDGTIVLTSTGPRSSEIRFNATRRSVTNSATGKIFVRAGAGGSRTLAANLVNNGLVRLETPTAFNYPDGVYLNIGILELAPAATLAITGIYSGPGILALQPGPLASGTPAMPSITTTGLYTLEGTLRIAPTPGTQPPLGTPLPLLTGPFTGQFAALDIPLIPGSLVTIYSLNPTPGAFSLRRRDCSADYNADGAPDQEDLSNWISDYFADPALGWANGGNSFAVPCPTLDALFAGGLAADFNADCVINQEDLAPFITAYFLDAESCAP